MRHNIEASILAAVIICFCAVPGSSLYAADVPGQEYFSIGGGGGMLANGQPCPDLPCNSSDVCSCVQSSGELSYSTNTKLFPVGSYTLEVSADKSTIMPNGVGGHCYGSGGLMVLTTAKGTLSLQFSGVACRLGLGGGEPEAVPYGMNVPATIVSSTGSFYTNPLGTGTLAATFNPATKLVLVNLVGYGILHRGAGSP